MARKYSLRLKQSGDEVNEDRKKFHPDYEKSEVYAYLYQKMGELLMLTFLDIQEFL
jgi:hypothetical protein